MAAASTLQVLCGSLMQNGQRLVVQLLPPYLPSSPPNLLLPRIDSTYATIALYSFICVTLSLYNCFVGIANCRSKGTTYMFW